MYFPKSQIISNLHTNGGEYIYASNKQEYIGYYWKLASGKVFTGKTPQDTPNQLLVPMVVIPNTPNNVPNLYLEIALNAIQLYEPDVDTENEILTYASLKNIDVNTQTLLPYYSPTIPTQQDYQTGEFRRCFCKKIDEIIYLEINKETYGKLIKKDPTIAFKYYQAFNVPWQLTGDKEQVYTTNCNIVELTMKQQKLPQFDLYLKKDYIKYYR
jgi:hypothetical protein